LKAFLLYQQNKLIDKRKVKFEKMNRNDFLSVLGVSAGTVIFAPFLASCSKNSSVLGAGGTVDFTLDLTLAANSVLNSNGGSVYKSGVIVARTSAGAYIAVSSACTHQGSTINFVSASNRFICPNHGANFSTTGSVLLGPATSPLTNYNTSLSGTLLRIYS
jgi:cytochrome b6-f complex iron-sulfur subunit